MPFPARIDASALGEQALAVAEARGWDHWTLRDVAQALGVTPNALYRHVGDRAGLVVAMGEAATRALHAALAAGPPLESDEDMVIRMTLRMADFAKRRPHAYAAFMRAKPAPDDAAALAWLQLWDLVNATVRVAVPASGDAAAFALWALLVGRIELYFGPAAGAPLEAGLEASVRALMAGFRSVGPVMSPLPSYAQRDPSRPGRDE
ncbi:MAG: helix-turn-helix domain-containing protein [Myxococcota bacterium]